MKFVTLLGYCLAVPSLSVVPQTRRLLFKSALLTLSGPAFSVVRQARGGGGGLRGPNAKDQG